MKVKVCGMTQLLQLQQLTDMHIDYLGLIFYPKSPRYAGDKLDKAAFKKPLQGVKKVGVFVNATFNDIEQTIEEYDLQLVQLHGEESPEFCRQVRTIVPVVKAFRIGNIADIDALVTPYEEAVDYYLFDTATEKYGGSGKQFDWSVLKNATINKPFFLSGGIGPDDVKAIQAFQHPFFFAIDINSRFESAAGVKNIAAIQHLLNQL